MHWSWSRFPPDIAPLPAVMQQHPAYAATCALWGREVCWALLGPPEDPVATAQVVLRRLPLIGRVGLVSRGPVWRQGVTLQLQRAALAELTRSARAEGLRALVVTPGRQEAESSPPGVLRLAAPRRIAEIDLSRPEADHRRALHGKWRNRLVRAEGSGLEVRPQTLPPDPCHWLLRAEADQQRVRGYRGLPPGFAAAWSRANPGQTRLFTARRDGRIVAAMLFLLHAPGATYQIGWTGPEGRATGAHNLLLWLAARHLSEAGFRVLDLGGVDRAAAPGLARFKLGAGAVERQTGATWLDPCLRLWQRGRARGTAAAAGVQKGTTPVSP